jgi:hypothetical protein
MKFERKAPLGYFPRGASRQLHASFTKHIKPFQQKGRNKA